MRRYRRLSPIARAWSRRAQDELVPIGLLIDEPDGDVYQVDAGLDALEPRERLAELHRPAERDVVGAAVVDGGLRQPGERLIRRPKAQPSPGAGTPARMLRVAVSAVHGRMRT